MASKDDQAGGMEGEVRRRNRRNSHDHRSTCPSPAAKRRHRPSSSSDLPVVDKAAEPSDVLVPDQMQAPITTHSDSPLLLSNRPAQANAMSTPASQGQESHSMATVPFEHQLHLLEMASLECPVCYDWMQPPFMKCKNEHPICSECRPSFKSDECPICRASIERDSLLADGALEALASRLSLPCANGCGAVLPYKALRQHQQRTCDFAPKGCPFREVLEFGPAGWRTAGRCECRGLDIHDAEAMSAHLCNAHACVTQPLDKIKIEGEHDGERERTCTWTLVLPTADIFQTPASTKDWVLPAVHRWPATILVRSDGRAFLVQCFAARHSGLSLLVLGLSHATEGMRVEAQVTGQQGGLPPYIWTSKVFAADAMRPGVTPEDEARLLRRAVAFPEAALEFCTDKEGKLKIELNIRNEDEWEEDMDEETFDFINDFILMDEDDDEADGEGEEEEEDDDDDDDDDAGGGAVASAVAGAVADTGGGGDN